MIIIGSQRNLISALMISLPTIIATVLLSVPIIKEQQVLRKSSLESYDSEFIRVIFRKYNISLIIMYSFGTLETILLFLCFRFELTYLEPIGILVIGVLIFGYVKIVHTPEEKAIIRKILKTTTNHSIK